MSNTAEVKMISDYDGSFVHTDCAAQMGRIAEQTAYYAIDSNDPEFRCLFCDVAFDISSL